MESDSLLIGDWGKIEIDQNDDFHRLPIFRPFGISFSEKEIELYNGFVQIKRDSISGKRINDYKGLYTSYNIRKESIFIKDPFSQNWEFKWTINQISKDTLVLERSDSTFIKLKKIKPNENINFDQIVFSRSGCFGSCPIIDISINKNGEVYFQGERYVSPLGFYKSKIDSTQISQIFSKFGRANIDSLSNGYTIGRPDNESVTTTFIKNGQILKTIDDYGRAGPKELIWAYVPIENLYTHIDLDSLAFDEPFYPKLHYYAFEKDSLILRLDKSESFYLWTELQKSKTSNSDFKPLYSMGFGENFTYWGSDPNEKRKHKYQIEKIESDGRKFKFYFKDQDSKTYDLGYNFIEKNFKDSDFKEKTKYD
ncbi:DUF6438 domain-containing protein [Aureivirga sp. CE67]|uniref:DUF6438 domain-containing protein n=1 Tax=Aureivirga sp. CE67 TaxID=1788983 RepID=UPI0018CBDCF5|nr:DUF6438 domain-containing protein [Aureivirga sp. CE67]